MRSWLGDLPENVLRICQYGFVEMANNANDHSEASEVLISGGVEDGIVKMTISDGGVGIFAKIKEFCRLDDDRTALLELTKGKLTTDPTRHTGEGIFFSSRMFDEFSILSGHLFLNYDQETDWLMDTQKNNNQGTVVQMKISTTSERTTKEVFDRYATDQNDFGFKQTTVSVKLAQTEGEVLLSRSHARRLLARLENFPEVVLDFNGVTEITPAFADEIFRVWRKTHPETNLVPVRTSESVERMIKKSQSA